MVGRLLLVLLASLLSLDGTTPAGAGGLSLLAGDLAGRAAVAVLGWVLLAAAASRLARVPGLVGSLAATLQRVLLPRAMRAAVLGLVGSQAVVGVALADGAAAGRPGPLVSWEALAVQRPAGGPADPLASVPDPTPRPAALPAPPTVIVAPGDTLWTIAGRHLPPGASDADLAGAWPAWYAANGDVIGPDPDVLAVGTVLAVPAAPAWSEVGR
jgi:hypothetical protein